MADLDLATILADGEYLRRVGDTLDGGPGGSGVDAEGAVDAVAAALVEGTGIDIVYDDTANTITLSSGLAGSTILDGSGPPDAVTVGEIADYYEDTLNGILYGPKSASGWGASQRPTIASTPNTNSSIGIDEAGARYRFARAGKVTGVRYQRWSAAATTLTIKAWKDSTATKVAEVVDTQAAVTGAFTVTFPTPIAITANETWTFTYATTGEIPFRVGAQAVTGTTDVTFIEFRTGGTIDTYPNLPATTTYYLEPIFEPNEAWPVAVRTINGYQATNVALTDLAAKYTPATATVASLLKFAEATNNGTNMLTFTSAAALAADYNVIVPAANGQVCLIAHVQTLTNKTIDGASNTLINIPAGAVSRTITTYSAVSNTGVIGDAGCYLRFTGTNPTFTVPPNSAVAFPVGTVIVGIGTVTAMTLIAGSGVTIVKSRTLVTTGAGCAWTLIKVATDTWDVAGDFV